MSIRFTTTSEASINNGLKMTVYGVSGAGKTTLCGTWGMPSVIISAEAGLLSLKHLDIPVIEIANDDDLLEAYRFLNESSDAKQFEAVSIDSLSEIAEIVLASEKQANRDVRAAYGALSDKMTKIIRAFRDLPCKHVLFTAKLDKIKDEMTGSILYAPSMPGQKLGQALPYFTDEVFALRVEKDNEGNIQRWLQTQPDYQWSAKDRSNSLNPFEEPNLEKIVSKILSHNQHPQQPQQTQQTINQTEDYDDDIPF